MNESLNKLINFLVFFFLKKKRQSYHNPFIRLAKAHILQ